jgi:dephospho-CoA kinase
MRSPLRVGLTGGIACGKTQVLARMARAGFKTLDLDTVAHEVMAPGGPAHEDVVRAFGSGILGSSGMIDRKVLGALVFRDDAARQQLNEIVHPRVWNAEARLVAEWSSAPGAVVVTDAALLIESGFHLRFDRLVVVHCPPEVQLNRLMARDGLDEGAARARLAAQMPVDEKRRFAHYEIATTGSMEETLAAADALALEIEALAREERPPLTLRRDRAIGCLRHGPRRGPRGLSPSLALGVIASEGSIRMEGLKARLSPPSSLPWYRTARAGEAEPWPSALAGVLTLWQLSRGVSDEEVHLAAMASVARLTHDAPFGVGNACVLGLAFLQEARQPSSQGSLMSRLARWRARAERWARGTFPDAIAPVLTAVEAHPGRIGEIRASAARLGGDPDLAGALAGFRYPDSAEWGGGEDEALIDAILPQ